MHATNIVYTLNSRIIGTVLKCWLTGYKQSKTVNSNTHEIKYEQAYNDAAIYCLSRLIL